MKMDDLHFVQIAFCIKESCVFLVFWVNLLVVFFDGGYSGKTKTRDYIDEQIRNTEKQIATTKTCKFVVSDFKELQYPKDSIIYCDIPYYNTKQYSTSKDFSHEDFWEWARGMSRDGHTMFISEYQAPGDFTCVWQKEVTNSLHPSKTVKPIEKLFTFSD